MESIAGLLPFVLILAVFWLLLIRPQRNRARQMAQMQASLQPGQQVMTTSGLYATVIALDEESVTLETAPGARSRWTRAAVARILTPVATEGAPAPEHPDRTDRNDDGTPGTAPR